MDDPSRNRLVRDVARSVVSRIAPQELPVFRVQSDAYFRSPEAALKQIAAKGTKNAKDEALGFGVTEAMTLLTPVALTVVAAVVGFLLEIVHASIKAEAADALGSTVKGLFRESRGDDAARSDRSILPLTDEQVARVRQAALEKALQLRLPEDQASLLADAVVGSLAAAQA